ncbi:hypothetical protein ETAA8_63520 [Anatilimnocola aggregata]|uniref:Uncharacterized protein n=1 Tax=Anatilimnocola aggregata TaxID=2528021 RepID=A0A517YLU7_9BACT|nr:hypothetical protein [Anatilimnocola aggregata]QDU31199.1 hypothetical protein ETAA8_63520 [Anatilimnocola aggregata]
MKNTTDQSTGASLWSARPEPATELHRAREMPLLFQLADINRLPPVPATAPVPAAMTAQVAASPAPIEMSPLPGSHAAVGTPIVAYPASTFSDPWPKTPTGLFETPSGLSTTALTMGLTTSPSEDRPQRTAKTPASAKPLPEVKSEPLVAPAIASTLPAAIETAVKAAALVSDAGEAKVEIKAEAKTPAKSEVKAEAKVEAKTDVKSEAKPAAVTVAATSAPKAEATDAAASAAKPSPGSLRRQRNEARQQKVAGKGGDWLQSHGKIIAIGFVFALIGTIYLARRNQPKPEVADPNTSAPVGLAIEEPGHHDHDHPPTEAANTAPRLVEAPSHPLDTTPSPATADANKPGPSSTADLHPPMPNPTPANAAPSGEPLFPWQQSGEARVATRPDAPAATAPAASNAPATAPTLNAPQYPETNLRDAPLLPPAPPDEQGSGRAPSRTSPTSFTSTPGGNRYERTGSGLY